MIGSSDTVLYPSKNDILDLNSIFDTKSTIFIEDSNISDKNIELNNNSIEEYKEHHIEEDLQEDIIFIFNIS